MKTGVPGAAKDKNTEDMSETATLNLNEKDENDDDADTDNVVHEVVKDCGKTTMWMNLQRGLEIQDTHKHYINSYLTSVQVKYPNATTSHIGYTTRIGNRSG